MNTTLYKSKQVRRWPMVAALAMLLLVLSTAGLVASAGGAYLLNWWTVDAGGTTAITGEGYALGGTSGQHEADPTNATGSGYNLKGGFWYEGLVQPTADDPAEEPWWEDAVRYFLPGISN